MNDIMNPDQIAALFEAAKSGNVPEASSNTPRRQQRMRAVDFSRPTKFTADHQRRITRATDGFCLGAAGRLTAELRAPVEFETLNTSQVTWAAAQTQLPSHSLIVTLVVEPLGTRAMMTIESQFVLTAIEGLLGGTTAKAAKPRRFSEIDWMLSRRLVDSIVHQLSLAWHDLGSISFSVEDIDLQSDAGSIASVSEPTFMVMLEARMSVHSAAIAILIPWVAIAPVSDLIAGRDQVVPGRLGDSGIDQALAGAPVTVRAEVAALNLPVADILALEPGSVIRLGAHAADGISVYAENVELFRGQPGANGVRRAVQIRSAVEPEE
ncbi:MAG TPA: FliM/FliN family flagellar motor switch protein [Solirubrobacteraceae bacterium]|nr:FliM/FliN family flagellar motor switch protein [Solirubrobacteraceae bacterium]